MWRYCIIGIPRKAIGISAYCRARKSDSVLRLLVFEQQRVERAIMNPINRPSLRKIDLAPVGNGKDLEVQAKWTLGTDVDRPIGTNPTVTHIHFNISMVTPRGTLARWLFIRTIPLSLQVVYIWYSLISMIVDREDRLDNPARYPSGF